MMQRIIAALCWLLTYTSSDAAIYYVAVNGSDANPGTKALPFQTIQKAQTLALPGDTVYLRGGSYRMQESNIASYTKIQAYVVLLNKDGMENKPIRYWAYPGEKPVFDFTDVKPAGYRVHAFEVTGSWLHIKGVEVTGVQVPVVNANTQSICFSNDGGSHNIYEQLSMHDGQAIGFFLTSGSNNLILNCDAYRNYDSTSKAGGGRNGGNVDGFGNHPSAGSVGNIFRGCRAWLNSDDGYDCINAFEVTVFENCWAFYNGYSGGFITRGDGNGFKAGGYAARPFNLLPVVIPRNSIRFCLSVMNAQSGFYSNHHLAGSDWYNNTAYMNRVNFNMLNRVAKTEADYLTDGPGYDHVLKNNISFSPRTAGAEIISCDFSRCTIETNSFLNNNITVSASDFISLDTALLTAPRLPNGDLPPIDFMRPQPRGRLIDKGTVTGFPYYGKAPDLGCFETKQ